MNAPRGNWVRPTLNGLTAHTVQDATRDPGDWIVGPNGETGHEAIERLLANSERAHRESEVIVWAIFAVLVLMFAFGVI